MSKKSSINKKRFDCQLYTTDNLFNTIKIKPYGKK